MPRQGELSQRHAISSHSPSSSARFLSNNNFDSATTNFLTNIHRVKLLFATRLQLLQQHVPMLTCTATVAMTCDKCCTDSLQHKRLLLYFLEQTKCIPDPSHRASSFAATATEGSLSVYGVCVCAKEFIVENYQEADIFTESNFTLVPLGQRRHRLHRRKRNKLKRQSAINVH